MRGYITFEPETAAGGGGIALLIVMVAMAGALGNSLLSGASSAPKPRISL